MIAIGGGIFGCLTSFQAPISEAIGVDYALFFAVFVFTVVAARLSLAAHIGRQPPYPTVLALLGLMVAALLSWVLVPQPPLVYGATTVLFAVGYGLTYSVLNGIVANIEQQALAAPALLVFPLAYFLGLYGAPFLGGWVIATHVPVGVHRDAVEHRSAGLTRAGDDEAYLIFLCIGISRNAVFSCFAAV